VGCTETHFKKKTPNGASIGLTEKPKPIGQGNGKEERGKDRETRKGKGQVLIPYDFKHQRDENNTPGKQNKK